jgi:ubiquinone/menaquinone biosynthesis C-methylase UbiE
VKSPVDDWIEEAGEIFLKEIGISEGQKVLDFGCGSGNYVIPAARIVRQDGLVYALDKDKRKLDQLMHKAGAMGLKNIVRLDASGGTGIALESESIDAVLLCDVLHHYYFPEADGRKRLLCEVHRILKANALLLLCPTHLQSYMTPRLKDVEMEIEEASFYLEHKYSGTLIVHDNNLEKSEVINFRKRENNG